LDGFEQMGLSEAFIIYMAIGVPIGVYAIIRPKRSLKSNLVAFMAINILFWPLCATRVLVLAPETEYPPNQFVDGNLSFISASERSRQEFSDSISNIGDRRFRREVLDDFDRFTAISRSIYLGPNEKSISIPEILEIARHPSPSIALKCLARRSSRRLLEHRSRAIADLNSQALGLSPQDSSAYATALDSALFSHRDSNII
jgi:hypothetical protein